MLRILYAILIFMISSEVKSQIFESIYYNGSLELDVPVELANRIHSLDDFIGRFNGTHNAYGQKLSGSSDEYKRVLESESLFQEYRKYVIVQLLIDSLLEDSDRNSVEDFVNKVSNELLDYSSTGWYVEMPIQGFIQNENYSGKLILKVHIKNGSARWIIDDLILLDEICMDDVEHLHPEECDDHFIPPSSHDNGFIAVQKILNNKFSLQNHIIRESLSLDRLGYLVNYGDVSIIASQLAYFFEFRSSVWMQVDAHFQISGYEF